MRFMHQHDIDLMEAAVRQFLHDPATIAHLSRGRVERTIAADLAIELKRLFPADNIRVDSHYNKHLNAAKRLNGDVIELDIAIHQRGTDEHNLVAIELETNNRPERNDLWKLEGLTRSLGGYGYELGLFVVFGIGERAGELLAMEWYSDGQRL
jgi:hypothetical protein